MCVGVHTWLFDFSLSLPFLDMGVSLLTCCIALALLDSVHWVDLVELVGCVSVVGLWLAHVVFGKFLGPFYNVVGCRSIHLFSY